ncbi:hypothetical protein [Mucilaginibacter sp.]
MGYKILLIFSLLVLPGLIQKSIAQQRLRFDKEAFYNVMANGDINAIDNELIVVSGYATTNKEGYEGALLMKKANLISGPRKKLDLFKAGRIKLETAIINNPDNVENHFLRLATEEHAPKIVKYHADIEADKAIVIQNFNNLSPLVQHAILDYCKNSKVLHAEDFNSLKR